MRLAKFISFFCKNQWFLLLYCCVLFHSFETWLSILLLKSWLVYSWGYAGCSGYECRGLTFLGTDPLVSWSQPRGVILWFSSLFSKPPSLCVIFCLSFRLLVKFRKFHSRCQVPNVGYEPGNQIMILKSPYNLILQAEKWYFT